MLHEKDEEDKDDEDNMLHENDEDDNDDNRDYGEEKATNHNYWSAPAVSHNENHSVT